MNKNYKIVKLKDVTKLSNGKSSPKRISSGEFPVYGANGIIGHSDKYNASNSTIIIGRVGSYCGSVYFPQEKCWATDNSIKLEVKKSTDPLYIFYLLNKLNLNFLAAGSGQPLLNQEILGNLELSLPPLPEQKRISSILSSFDNKIEQLKKENNILEDIAQNIFKEWFVKYNFPNKDGKPYKDNKGKMTHSELGLIPEGWRVGKLKDIVEIKNGFAFKSNDYQETGYPIIRTLNFEDSGYINNKPLVYLSENKATEYNDFNLKEFDLCVVMVGASLGKTALVMRHNLPALQNQNMWSFKPIKENYRFYNKFVVQSLIKDNMGSASGSARAFFRKDFFYNQEVIMPDSNIVNKFHSITKNLYTKISLNSENINFQNVMKKLLLNKLLI